jgi:hypothetical protein
MSGISDVNAMVSGLTSSIDNALRNIKTDDDANKPKKVKEYEQDTAKASLNVKAMATDAGILTKDKTRLNVVSTLGKYDPVDFYKVKVSTAGNITLGQVGDSGIRFQFMDKTGNVMADSDPGAGAAYEAYKQMKDGKFAAAAGDYTVRIARTKDAKLTQDRDYAFQLQMGTYTEDYDTIARQPTSGGTSGSSYLSILNGGSASGKAGSLIALLSGDTSAAATGGLASILSGGRGSLVNGMF